MLISYPKRQKKTKTNKQTAYRFSHVYKGKSLSSVLKNQYRSLSNKVVSLFLAHYYVVAREFCAFASTRYSGWQLTDTNQKSTTL